eukprot:jgi/Bigna1/133835/aug1.22_g8543
MGTIATTRRNDEVIQMMTLQKGQIVMNQSVEICSPSKLPAKQRSSVLLFYVEIVFKLGKSVWTTETIMNQNSACIVEVTANDAEMEYGPKLMGGFLNNPDIPPEAQEDLCCCRIPSWAGCYAPLDICLMTKTIHNPGGLAVPTMCAAIKTDGPSALIFTFAAHALTLPLKILSPSSEIKCR